MSGPTAFLGILEASDRERLRLAHGDTRFRRHIRRINAALKRARGYQVAFEAINAHSDG